MTCPRCGKENTEENPFCGRCGLEFAKVEMAPPPDGEVRYCHKHRREPTNLSCGRCGKPICHRCVVIGPAGPRCKDCAKHKVPVSARAIAGDAKIAARGIFRQGPWAIYWWFLIASLVFGMVRGCMYMRQPPEPEPEPPVSRDRTGE